MTDLEQAAIDFFKAILQTGQEILGHSEFHFKIEASIALRSEDAGHAPVMAKKIQEALDKARDVAKPVTIDGTSAQ